MSRILFLAVGLCCVQLAIGTGYISHAEIARCYDCDYDPKDENQNQDYNQGSSYGGNPKQSSYGTGTGKANVVPAKSDILMKDGQRGFPRCALDRAADDQRYVRETYCQTGVCFIRKDYNGLVYRGCADSRNLPLGIDTNVQCQAQGLQPAVWWFCNGSLCNSGRFDGSSGVCASDQRNSNSSPPAGHSPGNTMSFSNPYTKDMQSNGTPVYGPSSAAGNAAKPAPGPVHGQTFEQVQQKLGYAGRNPVIYGGTGLTSEQTFQRFSAAAAAASPKTGDNGANFLPLQNSAGTSNTNAEATKSVGRVLPPEIQVQSAMISSGGKYQPQGQQQQQQQQVPEQAPAAPAAVYGDANNRKVSAAGTVQQDNSGTGVATPTSLQQPATMMVAPNGDADQNSNAAGYKTWDFIVLAQSRLQRLDDQAGAGGVGKVESNDIVPATKAPQKDIVPVMKAPQQDIVPVMKAPQQDIVPVMKAPQQDIVPVMKAPQQDIVPVMKAPQQDIVPVIKTPQQDVGQQQYRGSMPVSGVSMAYDSGSVVISAPAPTSPPSRLYPKLTGEVGHPSVELSMPVHPSAPNYGKHFQYSSSSSSEATVQNSETSGFNQCDGQCFDNPSGLFPDPSRQDGFIQCGPGMDLQSGSACHCCRPQRMRCPRNTTFDNVTKVCSGRAGDQAEVNNQSGMSAIYRR